MNANSDCAEGSTEVLDKSVYADASDWGALQHNPRQPD